MLVQAMKALMVLIRAFSSSAMTILPDPLCSDPLFLQTTKKPASSYLGAGPIA